MTENTKELLLEIHNISNSLREKIVAADRKIEELDSNNENLRVQLTNAETLVSQLKQEISELKSSLNETQTNLVEKSNGGRNNEAIEELVKEIDNYIEKLKK